MPKLNVRPPKLGQDGKYAVVYSGGKKIRLGKAGTEEAQKEYRRFIAEWAIPSVMLPIPTKRNRI